MRLSNNLMYQSNINKILDNQQGVANAQERVTTGKKYLSASESPSAYSQAALYTSKIQTNEQYTKNINQLNNRLNTEETVLSSITDAIQKAQTLTIQAGNGALNTNDKVSISNELEELQQTLLSLMNTRSEDGKYIFSGYQDSTQPYQFDASSGKYNYKGDQGQHSITIAEGVSVKSSDNGFNTFEMINTRLNVESNTPPTTGAITATVFVNSQAEYDAFHKENFNFDPSANATANTYTVRVSAGASFFDPDEYEILRDGVALIPAQTGTVSENGQINFAGLNIEYLGTAPGDINFTLEKPQKENVLNTLQSLIQGLNDTALNNREYQQMLSDATTQLSNANEQVLFTQSSLGGRMNAVSAIRASNMAANTQNQENRANLVEVDMAEAISELTKQETALQASQATFGRLANLSLFDYL
ncbi:flagellar hook-associated protein FlgL [Pseudoalteromonas sp. PS1M3]|uniref:flagellar hook-associated protein FlgL n=1 Tax=Pseudoalteromonas sp. PS1M3 TaxID=87791 RepID=UPI001950215D|nr:flagellar hook-associated protein FlgL [Pseudoalteromonas sp. PS1M3]BBW92232.1 flagellar hook-associated protein FlgL [Pseudoalteromonas sp. PS1M3]